MIHATTAHPARPRPFLLRQRLTAFATVPALALATALCALSSGSVQAQATEAPTQAKPAAAQKVLRYAFRVAETGFDPAQISDSYSKTVAAGIFDAPLKYEYLSKTPKLLPNTLVAMPEISADFKTLTFEIKPGIFFNDDAAFNGKKRELTAADYIYAIKRHYDPRWKSQNLYLLENVKILGLSELRQKLMKAKKPFDYDQPVEGLQELGRYKFQLKLSVGDPRFVYQFADHAFLGAVAREVVEFYGDKIMEHPVGTGAWALAEWRRSSKIVLEKNPNFREEVYSEQAPADKPELAAQVKELQGRRIPMIDRVEIAIIEENQPRWLSFVGDEADVLPEVPFEFAGIAFPGNKLAPTLAKKGVQMSRFIYPEIAFSYFNMEDKTVGGYTPEKIALRRAISLAMDVDKQIRLARRGQAIAVQGPSIPGVFGYDPAFKSEMSEYNLAKAKALLDLYGYTDKNGDGWRDMPDGSPLRIEYATQPDSTSRQLIELWNKGLDALQVKMVFKSAKWPENLKSANAGKLQMWGVSWVATTPDNDTFLALGDSKSKGNKARFNLPAYDALYQKQKALPDGPERQAVMREAQRLLIAYMPYKMDVHRVFTDLAQPWVKGYERNVFVRSYWNYVDIDPVAQKAAQQ